MRGRKFAGMCVEVFTQALGWHTENKQCEPVPMESALDAEIRSCPILMDWQVRRIFFDVPRVVVVVLRILLAWNIFRGVHKRHVVVMVALACVFQERQRRMNEEISSWTTQSSRATEVGVWNEKGGWKVARGV